MKEALMLALARSDESRREDRANRIEWLSANRRAAPGIVMDRMEISALRNEAEHCYIEGRFIATVIVTAAYVEQALVQELEHRGLATHHMMAGTAVSKAREHRLLGSALLDRCAALADRRNSYAHLRAVTDATSFASRFLSAQVHPDTIRERDAKEALQVMDDLFHATLHPGEELAIEE